MRLRGLIPLLAVGGFATVLGWAADPGVDPAAADEQTLKTHGVGTSDQALLEFLRKWTLDLDRAKINDLIRDLGAEAYETRERATARLVGLGSVAEPYLKKALESPDTEIVLRARECLHRIKRGMGAALPAAVVRVLARRRPTGATEALLAYLPFAPNVTMTDEIRTTLTALALRDGKPDAALLAALSDKVPIRRMTAAEAFCRAGATEPRPAIKKLLRDPEPEVRLKVALALANVREKDAIPVLIALLSELPRERGWPAEEALLRLAGDEAPNAPLGDTQVSRDRCRKAWEEWWRGHAATADLANLANGPPQLGYTIVVLLDTGKVLEVDKDGKSRWHIDGLEFPLDLQYLRTNRVLVAENHGNRVTERDLQGKVLWEKAIESPLMAQRLPSGNTFIATPNRMLEVTPDGKEVFSYTPRGGGTDRIMKAQKLRNGEIGGVLSGPPRYVQMDTNGKEIRSFPVNLHTSGGRIEVLPNGNVLVPENALNRLVEYDADGKSMWEAAVQEPIAAVRLPNGNTLVTSMSQTRAIELNPQGKEVWHYQAGTRVNRAYRR